MKKKNLKIKVKRSSKSRQTSPSKVKAKKILARSPKKETPLQFQIYSGQKAKPYPSDLPYSYNVTKLALLVRDPFWAYAYWDFSAITWTWIQEFFKKDRRAKAVLRIYNLTAKSFYDLPIQFEAQNWYLDLGHPDTEFEAELGLLDRAGRFHLISKSNRIKTPRNGPSSVIDPLWNAHDFKELYRLSGGGKTGRGSEISSRFMKI